jgi:tetratricopeptide (TPR) repeat protein
MPGAPPDPPRSPIPAAAPAPTPSETPGPVPALTLSAPFDVFLSYNRQDQAWAIELADALRARGLRPWIDVAELIPGRRWQDALEQALGQVRTTAVLIGGDGLGPWQAPEMRVAIDESVDRGLPVIPVLLPGAPARPELPRFLRAFTWVDLRRGLSPGGLERLHWGITGVKAGAGSVATPRAPHGPARHNLPYLSLGALFTGREQELLHLAADLDGAGAAAGAQDQLLCGLGGMGKSRLAVEYAWRYGGRYQAVLFVRAESRDGLRRGLAALAAADLLDLPERQAAKEDEAVAAVLRWLRDSAGWLLILDNADSQEAAAAVSEVLPRLAAGHVLITSRWTRWGAALHGQALAPLAPAEAASFLDRRTAGRRSSRPDDPSAAERLAALLGGLPLALEQAAAYIGQRRLSFAAYLDAWPAERDKVLSWYDPLVMAYPESVAVTWQRSFDGLAPAAAALLRLAAFLAPDPIPVALFEEGSEFLDTACQLLCDETGQPRPAAPAVRDALADLDAYSLIAWTEGTFTVHPMVQEVIRGRIPPDRHSEWIEAVLRLVNRHAPFDADDVRTWPVWDLLRPHAATVLAGAEAAAHAKPEIVLMGQLALYLFAKAIYGEAEPLMRRALAIDEATFGPAHPTVAICLNNLAQLLKATNRLSEAEPLIRRALVIEEASLGSDHPAVAICLNNLAQLLQEANRLPEAEPLMRRALAINETSYGPDHPTVALGLSNLAQMFQATDRLSDAEPLMRRALAIDMASYGPDHPNVARDLNNLAQMFQATNRLSEAELIMRRALAIDEASFGLDHPTVAIRLNNLAQLLRATNRFSDAEPLMLRALSIDEASFGLDHPTVAIRLNNLAELLQATNRFSEAEPLMRRALAIQEASFGVNHPEIAVNLNNLAQLLQDTNRLSEAESLMRRGLAIDEASFGPDHPNVARDLNNLAQLLKATNRVSEAEPLMRRVLSIDEVSFGPDHPEVAIDLNNLAMLLKAKDRFYEAEPLMRRALAIGEASFGPDHPTVAIRLNNLAHLLQAMNRVSEAEPLMRRAIAIKEANIRA